MKRPLCVFQRVLRWPSARVPHKPLDEGRWLGHLTSWAEGSSVPMPDAPALQDHFGQSGGKKPGCGLPVAHLMTRFHAGIGTVLRVLAAPLRTQDMFQVIALNTELHPSDVLVSDRGGCADVNSVRLVQGGVHAVFRVHQTHIVDCHRIVPMSAPLKAGARATREAALALVGKAWCVRSTRRVAGVLVAMEQKTGIVHNSSTNKRLHG